MDFIPILKAKKNAMKDCQNSDQLSPNKRSKLSQNIKIIQYSPWITKATLILGIVFGVNWKKQIPITKRQLPLAAVVIGLSALSDVVVLDWVWKQHEQDIVKLTGFKNGIYVSPERMLAMRSKML